MAAVAYFDCVSGASGDMILGALVSAGLSPAELQAELRKLHLSGYRLSFEVVHRGALAAVQARVELDPDQPRRGWAELQALVEGSALPEADRRRAVAILRRFAEAEARVHGVAMGEIEPHEVGGADTIIDVVGAVVGLRLLNMERVYVSPLPAGSGIVSGGHGVLPVPAPATLELLAGTGAVIAPSPDLPVELVTPTAAAVLTTIGEFRRPAMRVTAVGVGAGSRDLPDRPNVLRVWLGEAVGRVPAREMLLVETNIDDMNPELLPYVRDLLFAAGAADAWYLPIQMKKGRPAVQLAALCEEGRLQAVIDVILRETTTLGLRVQQVDRYEAEREVFGFESSLGPAAVKVKRLEGGVLAVAPEFEACRELAETSGVPIAEVYRLVEAEARQRLGE